MRFIHVRPAGPQCGKGAVAALALGVVACGFAPAALMAQALTASTSAVERGQRLLRKLRVAPPEAPPSVERAVIPPAPAPAGECGIGLYRQAVGHQPDVTLTPAYCEGPFGGWTVGVESDGYVRESGDGGAHGLADLGVYATYEVGAGGTSALGLTLGLSVPSNSPAGSTRSDQFGELALALNPWGRLQPKLTYEITRHGDPEKAGGRSSQRLSVALVYPWSGDTETLVGVARSQPRNGHGSTVTELEHTADVVRAVGLKARVNAKRSDGRWTNTLTVIIERTF